MTQTKKNHLVFVYGSLRRGGQYHHLLRDAVFVASAQTEPHYTLVDVGDYPALLNGGSHTVQGELYQVTEKTLQLLDELEGVPLLYQREKLLLQHQRRAWGYVMCHERARNLPLIASGDYMAR